MERILLFPIGGCFVHGFGDLAEYGYIGEYLKFARTSTPVVVPYEWQLPDGKTITVSLNRLGQNQAETELPGIAVQE